MDKKIKAKWERAELVCIELSSRDVVTASPDDDPYEGEIDRTSLYSSRPSNAGSWN